MASQWKIDGTYFETCNCETACPCIFLNPPTTGECTALVGWHITSGFFDDLDLQGLNVVMAVHSPGHMAETPWEVALYVDSKGNQEQQDALIKIFAGQAGGHPERLASHVGEVLGVKSVEISYRDSGKNRSLSIPGVTEAEIEAVEGQGGGESTISGHPFAVAPGYSLVVAKSTQLNFNDHGFQWQISEKNGFYSPFTYNS